MFRCDDCCELFENPEVQQDMVTDDPYPMYQNISVCPCCGSTDFIEVEECEECREYVDPDEMLEVDLPNGSSKTVCSYCYDEVYFDIAEEEE